MGGCTYFLGVLKIFVDCDAILSMKNKKMSRSDLFDFLVAFPHGEGIRVPL